ncbi:hypothetical protein ACTWQF_30455 [Streptomyces sp. 8N114]|uniref:hypothetical protein n=1 Tax=Streptomyces sp. 8N114 TaxID=3457419 RepID=UPI003FD3C9EA
MELSGGGDVEDEDVADARVRVAVVDVLDPKLLRGGLDDLNGDGIRAAGQGQQPVLGQVVQSRADQALAGVVLAARSAQRVAEERDRDKLIQGVFNGAR